MCQKWTCFVNYVAHVPKSPLPVPAVDERERRALAFFSERTAVELNNPFPSELWSRYILQTAQVEPVVRHAVIALASLHEDSQFVGPMSFVEGDYARLHYAKAIQHFINHPVLDSDQRISLALILCALFTTFDCLRGHTLAAFSHIQSGLRMIREEFAKGSTVSNQSSIPWKTFFSHFRHLESQMFEMQGHLTDGYDDDDALFEKYLPGSPPSSFQSLDEAQEAFEELYNSLNHYLSLHPEQIHLTPRHTKYVYYFNMWSAKFNAFQQSCQKRSTDKQMRRGIAILQIWQKMLTVRLSYDYDAPEAAYDEHMADFASIVALAELAVQLQARDGHPLKFSISTGVVPPLYMAATRCRDPLIRRRAVSLLRQCNNRDGLWASNVVAPVAERIVQLEEDAALNQMIDDGDIGVISKASQIPERCRIRLLHVQFGNSRQGTVSYGRRKMDAQGNRMRDDEIVFAEQIFW
ncbi:MAG: hypothetical protein Q9160_001350 [Pyrenula sp. 1 TL-2023]